MLRRSLALIASLLIGGVVRGEGLDAERLGVLYDLDDGASRAIAAEYAQRRRIPPENLLGVHLPKTAVMEPTSFAALRREALDRLPTRVQSLALVWSKPYAVGCMSITSAFAAGYRAAFCPSECARTPPNPLFNADDWLPADTVGWWPAMLLPSADPDLARALIARGIAADGTAPRGNLYLVRTRDAARNVRAPQYAEVEAMFGRRLRIEERDAPFAQPAPTAIGYFTGERRVEELARVQFLPGAPADHLTSSGGVLDGWHQMPILAWLRQGATASYGTVSEPCSYPGKFPDIRVLYAHYLRGDTILEAYWKSVAMPGQGLFIGEPLSRPYATRH